MSEKPENRNLPISIFYSYAQEDEALCRELETHLSLLRWEGKIIEWSKRALLAGSNVTDELDQKLLSASLILLFISPDFLSSQYVHGTEMHRALERHTSGEARVVPILLRPSGWRHTPLAHLKCLPTNEQPVLPRQHKDEAFQEIAEEIRRIVDEIYAQREPSSADSQEKPRENSRNPGERLLYTYDIHAEQSFSVAWSPDGTRIASGSVDNTVHIWQATTGQHLRTYRHPSSLVLPTVFVVRWSPDGKFLASAGKSPHIHVWDPTNGRDVMTYRDHSAILPGIYYLAWSPDGLYIASSNSTPTDDAFHIWNVFQGRRIMKLSLPLRLKFSIPGAGAWSPEGTRIAASWERRLQIHHAGTGKQIYTYENLLHRVLNVAWSLDSRYLIFSEGLKIVVWDTVTMMALHSYIAHTDTIRELALSPNGRYIASASEDRTVHIWELLNGKPSFIYKGHSDQVTAITWSPDGTRIASACRDKSIHVWRTLLN